MPAPLDTPSQADPSPAPDGCHAKLFTAGPLANFLGLSGAAIRKRLQNAPSAKVPTPGGQTANGWALADLPQDWQEMLGTVAKRKGYSLAGAMLSDESAAPWVPPVRFADVHERFQGEAMQWRNALMPILRCQHETDAGELCKRGMEECRKVFGRDI
ncbi:MAG: hypothetical protein NT154_04500, partial [Verrucomicrobia bacterium]|nr:hypothetical protein [Verrucomicrobiota bacterium]